MPPLFQSRQLILNPLLRQQNIRDLLNQRAVAIGITHLGQRRLLDTEEIIAAGIQHGDLLGQRRDLLAHEALDESLGRNARKSSRPPGRRGTNERSQH